MVSLSTTLVAVACLLTNRGVQQNRMLDDSSQRLPPPLKQNKVHNCCCNAFLPFKQHWKPIFWVQTGDFNNSCVVLHACVTQCIFKCRNIRCIPFFLFQHICQLWVWRHATQPNTVVQWIRTWTAWYHAINACGVRGWSGVCVTKAVGDGDVNVLICNQCLFLTQWQYFSIHIVFGKFNG